MTSTTPCPHWCDGIHPEGAHSGCHQHAVVGGDRVDVWPILRDGDQPRIVLGLSGPRGECVDKVELSDLELGNLMIALGGVAASIDLSGDPCSLLEGGQSDWP